MSSTNPYTGRTIDLLAFQGIVPGTNTLATPALVQPGNSGQLCTGIQKLCQRWLLELLTTVGSMVYQPERGCNFVQQLMTGQLQTTLDLQQAFGRNEHVGRERAV